MRSQHSDTTTASDGKPLLRRGLDKGLKAPQGRIPSSGHEGEILMGGLELARIQLPAALAARSMSPHQAGALENPQMLADRLSGAPGAERQSRDRLGPALAEAGHQLESRRVAERREDRGRSRTPGSSTTQGHGFWLR